MKEITLDNSSLAGPFSDKTTILEKKETVTTSNARKPLEAMKDYGSDKISKQERAEEAIRQHFRDLDEKVKRDCKIDKKV